MIAALLDAWLFVLIDDRLAEFDRTPDPRNVFALDLSELFGVKQKLLRASETEHHPTQNLVKSTPTDSLKSSNQTAGDPSARAAHPEVWLIAAYLSFFAWLVHSYAPKFLFASLHRLLMKFLMKA